MDDDAPPALPAIATILKLPPFWLADLELWFAQAEAQFATWHITTELTKFRHIVASLLPEVATEVRDILLGPTPTQPYTTLCTALIARIGITEDARLQQLLEDEQLGDHRPSQLLCHMHQLLGSVTMDDAVLCQLFLCHLPTACHTILARHKDVTDLSTLADITDEVHDITSSTATAAPTVALALVIPHPHVDATSLADMQQEIAALRRDLCACVFAHPSSR